MSLMQKQFFSFLIVLTLDYISQVFSMLILCVHGILFAYFPLKSMNAVTITLGASTFVIFISCAFVNRHRSIFQGGIKIATLISIGGLLYTTHYDSGGVEIHRLYLMGNISGVFEMSLLIAIRKFEQQIFVTTCFLIVKVAIISIVSKGAIELLLGAMLVFAFQLCFFNMSDKIFDTTFRILFKYNDELSQYQNLITEDPNISLAIMTNDLKDVLYVNKGFSLKFNSKNLIDSMVHLQNMMITWDKENQTESKCLLDSHEELIEALKASKNDYISFSATYQVVNQIGGGPLHTEPQEENSNQKDGHLSQSENPYENKRNFQITMRQVEWGTNPCFSFFMHDLTEKELVVALSYADKQKDYVIAAVSHEIRTPINGIMGMISIAKQYVTDLKQSEYLQHALNCCKLLLHLVNSILDSNQIRNNKLKLVYDYFSIQEVFDELKAMYQFQSEQKSIDLLFEAHQGVPSQIYGDMYRFIEILTNLIGNAFKFTTKGYIKLSITKDMATTENLGLSSIHNHHSYSQYSNYSQINPVPFTDRTLLSGRRDLKYQGQESTNVLVQRIKVSVEDTGQGIKQEDQGKLFKLFGKLEQNDKNINRAGVGLGLAISDQLVRAFNEQFGGDGIKVESKYGKGTKFSFLLPFLKDNSVPNIDHIVHSGVDARIGLGIEDTVKQSFENPKSYEFDGMAELDILKAQEIKPVYSIKPHRSIRSAKPTRIITSLCSLEEGPDRSEMSKNTLVIKSITADLPGILKRSKSRAKTTVELNKVQKPLKLSNRSIDEQSSRFVLVVDDNPFNQMAVTHFLGNIGYICKTVFNGKECLQMVSQYSSEIQFILMDLNMPVMSGIEATVALKSQVQKGEIPDIPIIALSADCTETTTKQCMEKGMIGSLSKPINQKEFLTVIEKIKPMKEVSSPIYLSQSKQKELNEI